MNERRRRLILGAAAALGLLVLYLASRRRGGAAAPLEAAYVAPSMPMGESSGFGGGGDAGFEPVSPDDLTAEGIASRIGDWTDALEFLGFKVTRPGETPPAPPPIVQPPPPTIVVNVPPSSSQPAGTPGPSIVPPTADAGKPDVWRPPFDLSTSTPIQVPEGFLRPPWGPQPNPPASSPAAAGAPVWRVRDVLDRTTARRGGRGVSEL